MRQKRPKGTTRAEHIIVDIKAEIPASQLAAIGAMALAFNETEAAVDRLFFAVTGLDQHLQLEVNTRINGIDGKLEIIKVGAKPLIEKEIYDGLSEALGKSYFKELKTYRDCVIHVRHLNALTGVGVKVDRQADVYDTLVSINILDAAYNLLVILRKEITEITSLVIGIKALRLFDGDDQERARLEAKIASCRAQALQHRSERQSLPPLPEYPSESQLRLADFQANTAQTEVLMHSWYQPFSQPQPARSLWLYHSQATDVPLPPKENEKKKP